MKKADLLKTLNKIHDQLNTLFQEIREKEYGDTNEHHRPERRYILNALFELDKALSTAEKDADEPRNS